MEECYRSLTAAAFNATTGCNYKSCHKAEVGEGGSNTTVTAVTGVSFE